MNEPESEPYVKLRNRLDHNSQRLWNMNRPIAELLLDAAYEIDRLGHRVYQSERAEIRLARTVNELRDRLAAAEAAAKHWEDKAFIANAH